MSWFRKKQARAGRGRKEGDSSTGMPEMTGIDHAAQKKARRISRRRFLGIFTLGTATGAAAIASAEAKRLKQLGKLAGNTAYNAYMDAEIDVPADLRVKTLLTPNPEFEIAGDSLANGTGNVVNGHQIPFAEDLQNQARKRGYPRATARSHAVAGSPMSDVARQVKDVAPPAKGVERVFVGWTGHNFKEAETEAKKVKDNPLGNIFDYIFFRRRRLAESFGTQYEAMTRNALNKLGTKKGILLLLEPFELAPRLVLIKPDGSQEVIANLEGNSIMVKGQRVGLKDLRLAAGYEIIRIARKLNKEGYDISVANPGKTIKKGNFGKSKEMDQHPNSPAYQQTAKEAISTRERRFPS